MYFLDIEVIGRKISGSIKNGPGNSPAPLKQGLLRQISPIIVRAVSSLECGLWCVCEGNGSPDAGRFRGDLMTFPPMADPIKMRGVEGESVLTLLMV